MFLRLNYAPLSALKPLLLLLPLALFAGVPATGWSQPMEPLEPAQNQPPTYATSYRARILERGGIRDVDPNIYVYSAAFAQRFQMPEEWISDELTGAEAAAFRMVPAPKSCGWNWDLNNCREDEVMCELDLYFDSNKQQLPWDERAPVAAMNIHNTSVLNLYSDANRLYRPASTENPRASRSAFTNHVTGDELRWQIADSIAVGWVPTFNYDREIFKDISMLTLFTGCGGVKGAWLSNKYVYWKDVRSSPRVAYLVSFPETWRQRITAALKTQKERDHAFYKREGEKALEAINKSRKPATSVVPLE